MASTQLLFKAAARDKVLRGAGLDDPYIFFYDKRLGHTRHLVPLFVHMVKAQ